MPKLKCIPSNIISIAVTAEQKSAQPTSLRGAPRRWFLNCHSSQRLVLLSSIYNSGDTWIILSTSGRLGGSEEGNGGAEEETGGGRGGVEILMIIIWMFCENFSLFTEKARVPWPNPFFLRWWNCGALQSTKRSLSNITSLWRWARSTLYWFIQRHITIIQRNFMLTWSKS